MIKNIVLAATTDLYGKFNSTVGALIVFVSISLQCIVI